MRIAIGSDHAGFVLKEKVIAKLCEEHYDVSDLGAYTPEPTGVGPFVRAVVHEVLGGRADRGILICGTGGGMSIMSNRYPGIRAILCFDEFTAEYARRHNDANVLILGARTISEDLALRLVDIFLTTPFEGGKYAERLKYLEVIEKDVWKMLQERFLAPPEVP